MISLSIVTISLADCPELQDTINSIRCTHRSEPFNLQHIIVSPDLQCKQYENSLTTYICRERHGIYDAMNYAVAHCDHDYVLFINAGDKLLTIVPLIDAISRKPTSSIYGFAILRGFVNELVVPKLTSPHQGTVYRRSVLSCFRFDTRLRITADRDLFDRIRFSGKLISFSDKPIAWFDANGVSSAGFLLQERIYFAAIELFFRRPYPLRIWRVLRYFI